MIVAALVLAISIGIPWVLADDLGPITTPPVESAGAFSFQEDYGRKVNGGERVEGTGDGLFGESVDLATGATSFSVTDVSLPGNNSLPVAFARRRSVDQVGEHPRLALGDWEIDVPYLEVVTGRDQGWVVDTDEPDNRCSSPSANGYNANPGFYYTAPGQPVAAEKYWLGIHLSAIGAGKQELLHVPDNPIGYPYFMPDDGETHKWVTSGRWYFHCESAGTVEGPPTSRPPSSGAVLPSGHPGDSFVGHAPDGTTYKFDYMVVSPYASINLPYGGTTPGSFRVDRDRVRLYPTVITDRFGNTVSYVWNSGLLDKIESSDGRLVDIEYISKNGHIVVDYVRTTDNSGRTPSHRTWHYEYDITGSYLSKVILPDLTSWDIGIGAQFGNGVYAYTSITGGGTGTQQDHDVALKCNWMRKFRTEQGDNESIVDLKHPSGARAKFTFEVKRFGRANVDVVDCLANADQQISHFAETPARYDAWALTSKRLLGIENSVQFPGQSYEWLYSYGGFNAAGQPVLSLPVGNFCESPNCPVLPYKDRVKLTTVTAPDGSKVEHVYGIRYQVDDGQLLTKRVLSPAGVELQKDEYTYVGDADAQTAQYPFAEDIGSSPQYYMNDSAKASRIRPQKKAVISRTVVVGTTTDTTTFVAETQEMNSFAASLRVERYSSLGYKKIEKTTYHNDLELWVTGQVKTTRVEGVNPVSPEILVNQVDYDAKAMPWKAYDYGRLVNTATYESDGTLKTLKDSANRITEFSNYYRGTARLIHYPDLTSKSASVNDHGWVTGVTNQVGDLTNYDYNLLSGRLEKITYPTYTGESANPRIIEFAPLTTVDGGVAMDVGHWRQRIKQGNYQQSTYFDAFWRPVLSVEEDTSSTATRRYTVRSYDHAGEVFASYPVTSGLHANQMLSGSQLKGIFTEKDALGRTSKVQQTSELSGIVATTTNYEAGFEKVVTNPKSSVTRTKFYAYDQPAEDLPSSVLADEGGVDLSIIIDRDIFGKPRSIKRSGVYSAQNGMNQGTTVLDVELVRHYVYDNYQRLCKKVDPDAGVTVQAYDGAGNVEWAATGLSLTNTGGCEQGLVNANRKASFFYDDLNRLLTTTYADNGVTENIYRTYTADGLPLTSRVGPNQSAGPLWSYEYTARRLPKRETLTIDGKAHLLKWDYDANGNRKSVTYPDDEVVDYSPNALGQPTQAISDSHAYIPAASVSYHPNGAVKGFNYGNGIGHLMTPNARGLPERSWDVGVLNDVYTYDAAGNVEGIDDQQRNVTDRTMTYDGLNRLLTVNAPGIWSASIYGYDPLDNIRRSTIGTRVYNHVIDEATNRLDRLTTTTGSTVSQYLYDLQGNIRQRGSQQFIFDQANRLIRATGKATYSYDGWGRRVKISNTDLTGTYPLYSQGGQLLYEVDYPSGKSRNYIYLGKSLLARNESTPVLPPPAPVLSGPASSSTGSFTLTWTSVDRATSYVLEQCIGTPSSCSGAAAWLEIPKGGATHHDVHNLSTGSFRYRVRASGDAGYGPYSNVLAVAVQSTNPPTMSALSVNENPSTTGHYTISWHRTSSPSEGAAVFTLEERQGTSGEWVAVAPSTTETSWTTPDPKPNGISFTYRAMICLSDKLCSDITANTLTVTVHYPNSIPAPAQITATENPSVNGSYTINWTKVGAASSYVLEEKQLGAGWEAVFSGKANSKQFTGRRNGTYVYRVKACTGQKCGGWSSELQVSVEIPGIPSAPGPLTVNMSMPVSMAQSYLLEWSYSGSVSPNRYELERRRVSESSWTTLQSTLTTSFVPPTPHAPGKYLTRVSACNKNGCSAYRYGPTIQVQPAIMGAPSVSPVVGGSFTVSWAAVAGATYQLEERLGLTGAWGNSASGLTSTSTPRQPSATGVYFYRIRACVDEVCGEPSPASVGVEISSSPPCVPEGLTSSAIGGSAVPHSHMISWQAACGAASYFVERKSEGSSEWISVASTTSLSGGDSVGWGSHEYRVKACNTTGCSAYRSGLTVIVRPNPPAAPTSSSYSTTDGIYSIQWTGSLKGLKYDLSESVDYPGNANGGDIVEARIADHSYAFEKDSSGTFYYQVRVCPDESSICSEWSPSSSAVVVTIDDTLPPPTGLSSSAPTGSSLPHVHTVSWNSVAGATSYVMEREPGGSGIPVSSSAISQSQSLSGWGSYRYRVKACHSSGAVCSVMSSELVVAVKPPTPMPPTVASYSMATGSYDIQWVSSGSGLKHVLQERVGANAGWSTVATVAAGSATSVHFDKTTNASYYYRVQACTPGANPLICGDFSGESAEVLVNRPGVPDVPEWIAVPATDGDGRVSINWASVSGAATYKLERKVATGSAWTPVPHPVASATSQTDAGLSFGTYQYQVSACNSNGQCGGWRQSASLVVKLDPPAGLTSTPNAGNYGSFTVRWDAVSEATSYNLRRGTSPSSPIVYSGPALSALETQTTGVYSYQVQACAAPGCGDWSAAYSNGVVATPTGLTAAGGLVTVRNHTVTWNTVDGSSRYRLEKMGVNATDVTYPLSTTESFANQGNGWHYYRVSACVGSGDSLVCGDYSSQVSLAQEAPPPPAIAMSGPPSPSTNGTFSIGWTPALNNDATFFYIDENFNNQGWQQAVATEWLPTATTLISDRGNGTYKYRARACYFGVTGPVRCADEGSAPIVTVTVARPGVPDAPSAISAGSLQCRVSWTPFIVGWAPAVAGATKYNLKEEVDVDDSYSQMHVIPNGSTVTYESSRGVGNLGHNEVTYKFSIQACNALGCSGWVGPAEVCRYSSNGNSTNATQVLAEVRYLHTDALGSPVAETDEGGTVVKRTNYEPYGAPADGDYQDGPGYTGHVTDAATGLSYMQQRYYDPIAARFLSNDPVEASAENFNRYWYASNNPYRFIDPDGRLELDARARYYSQTQWKGSAVEAMKNDAIAKDVSSKLRHVETKGVVAGKPDVEVNVTAADRAGAELTIGLYNADSKGGLLFSAQGASASIDTSFFGVSYDGPAKNSPVEAASGFDFKMFRVFGFRVSGSYVPPDKIEFDLRIGVGVGASSSLFGVGVNPGEYGR